MHRRRRRFPNPKNKEEADLLKKVKEGIARMEIEKAEAKKVPWYLRDQQEPKAPRPPLPMRERVLKPRDPKMEMLDALIEEQEKRTREEEDQRSIRETREREEWREMRDEELTNLQSEHPRALVVNINFGCGLFDLFNGLGSSSYSPISSYSRFDSQIWEHPTVLDEKRKCVALAINSKQKRENKKKYVGPEKVQAKRRNPPRTKHGCNRQLYGRLHNKR